MRTLHELRRWAEQAPPGTTVPATALVELLDGMTSDGAGEPDAPSPPQAVASGPRSWQERLWEVPAETRLSVDQVVEALGRSRHAVYRACKPARRVATGGKKRDGSAQFAEEPNPARLPSRKLAGSLVFTAGEVRAWIRDQEHVQHGGRMLSVVPDSRRREGVR